MLSQKELIPDLIRRKEKMIFKIKETCSCGAILEYEEKVDDAYQQYCGQRQISFQRTHEKCRLSQPEEKEEVG